MNFNYYEWEKSYQVKEKYFMDFFSDIYWRLKKWSKFIN
jgi:hypothetical protein